MNFFKQIFQAESPVSSRRLIAFWVAFIILSYVVFTGVTPANAIDFLVPILVFIGALLGITTAQNIVSIVNKKK